VSSAERVVSFKVAMSSMSANAPSFGLHNLASEPWHWILVVRRLSLQGTQHAGVGCRERLSCEVGLGGRYAGDLLRCVGELAEVGNEPSRHTVYSSSRRPTTGSEPEWSRRGFCVGWSLVLS
jgi:hypothetical protein